MNWIITLDKFVKLFLPGLIILFMAVACGGDESQKKAPVSNNQNLEKSLIDANKKAVKTEDQQINDFIDRYKWDMVETGTGLRYRIYENGEGKKASTGMIAVINYEVSLLDGTVVYSSENSGPKEFMIGRGGVESGLEEGILYLHEGDRAKFILPSHLAHGLSGDQDKITGKATLVYDVELIKLK